ncbi:proteinase-activated receptor 1-like [Aquarana catesbeiana]|uniref:proteinase-activated receptor 1-like n=1 Tax=Aquarana catesbeiana TaxID=8400 RepID=UPI003CC9D5A2
MDTPSLLPILCLSVMSFWNVDCYNETSVPSIEIIIESPGMNEESIPNESFVSSSDKVSHEAEDFLSSWPMTTFIPSVFTIVVIISLPLNVLAVIIFLFKFKLKTPALVYMLNLATADVLYVSMLLFSIVYRFSGNNWSLGEEMCRFFIAALYCNMYCSILLMTSVSVDRFLAIVYPMESLLWRTKKRAWLVCIFIWILSIAGTVPLLTSELTQYVDSLGIVTCYDVLDITNVQNFSIYYFTPYITLFFFLPLIITTFCYIRVIQNLSSPKNESPFKRSRSVFLSLIVLCEFVVCFGPTNVIFVIYYLQFYRTVSDSLYSAYILCASVSSISCCLDPIIYYYASPEISKYLYSLLSCTKIHSLAET